MGDRILWGEKVIPRVLVLWFGLGASTGFLLWTLRSDSQEIQRLETGLAFYGSSLLIGLLVGGISLLLFRWVGAEWESIGLVGYLSSLFYLGFLKVLGWSFIPWLLIVAVFILLRVFLHRKKDLAVGPSLVLFHVMGTVSGLYMAFHLRDFLKGWGPFQDVVKGLWLILSQGIF
jgi:hypothetical protein